MESTELVYQAQKKYYAEETGRALEDRIRAILVDFGYSIDPQGYDDGDFNTAVKDLKDLFEEFSK